MKDKDRNLEKNISRLVKQVGDSDTPSKGFTNSLIDEALDELKQQPVGLGQYPNQPDNQKNTHSQPPPTGLGQPDITLPGPQHH